MALINGRILAHDIGMKSKNPHINMHTPQAIKDTNELYFFACNVRMAELVYILHTCTYHLPVGIRTAHTHLPFACWYAYCTHAPTICLLVEHGPSLAVGW